MAWLKPPEKFDYILFIATVCTVLFGILMIFSIVLRNSSLSVNMIIGKQFKALLLGLLGIIVIMQINYKTLKELSPYFYALSIILLVLVIFLGKPVRGTRSWFFLGPVSFQPAELSSLALIIFLAKLLDDKKQRLITLGDMLGLMFVATLPLGLILIQPDMGTSLVVFPIMLGMLYVANIKRIYLFGIITIISLAAIIPLILIYIEINMVSQAEVSVIYILLNTIFSSFTHLALFLIILLAVLMLGYYFLSKLKFNISAVYVFIIWLIMSIGLTGSFSVLHLLKGYQRQRLVVFLNPQIDSLGAGYNIIQSKIAIGSGKLFGRGLFNGTQAKLGFLPEQHTDFIFSVICEELGFIGATVIIVLLFLIVLRGIKIVQQAEDNFGTLLASGIVCMFAFQIVLNIGMVIGIMPITGIPLPFVSYGGSSLFFHMLAVGLLLNIKMRRFMY